MLGRSHILILANQIYALNNLKRFHHELHHASSSTWYDCLRICSASVRHSQVIALFVLDKDLPAAILIYSPFFLKIASSACCTLQRLLSVKSSNSPSFAPTGKREKLRSGNSSKIAKTKKYPATHNVRGCMKSKYSNRFFG